MEVDVTHIIKAIGLKSLAPIFTKFIKQYMTGLRYLNHQIRFVTSYKIGGKGVAQIQPNIFRIISSLFKNMQVQK